MPMPALLGPTNPVPGYEPQPVKITTPAPGDTNVQNIVDPNRVVRPDQRTDRQDTGDAANAARYESNFMTFVQRLRNAQNLPETFLRMLQGQGLEVTSGIRSGFAGEMAQFLEFLKMDESQLLAFLQGQGQSGARFGGALFSILRNAYANTQSDLLRTDILQFLRRFSDYTSTDHLEGKILRSVSDMTESLPSQWANQVSDILAKLQNGVAAGDRAGNLKLLREELFPLISRYVSLTHDHGRARGLLSMLTLDVARYENGSEKELLQAMRRLASSGVLPGELSPLSDKELLKLLRETNFLKASDPFADQLAKLASRALQGQAGPETQEMFHNIMASILINESVYMPLSHTLLPLDWNGKRMFSEMWVDPDADSDPRRSASGGGGTMRILIKMDIESLGAFDLLIHSSRQDGVSLSLACPQAVAAFSDQVSQTIHSILSRNGLKVGEVSVAEMKRPVTVSEVFPKLFERMNGVNVKI